ncbi:hypothetical protein P168DRAFT_330372 [Aspergillus campestris IBT 28561]|uniref:Uncharacterized protein n=1 Tax=Aspergillus campestris (strain IBT 28561) TaxID=1392248 RepID=A0A2I1CSI5_ASPC2|nr:uncharacterized protein P168DRAFT_330372 [Aspergillus campestris IBT 28561]PKY00583.1 hypothetical protein P168DRAFT_330372 [Aspergillus campestris IBT 28561]
MKRSINDTVKADHVTILACHNRIVYEGDRKQKIRFRNLFTWEVARTLVSKELVLLPAMEKFLPEGDLLARQNRDNYHAVKAELKRFQKLDPTSADFLPSINKLMGHLQPQIREEEAHQLPMLEGVITDKESDGLAKSFNRTKIFLPTRAHPGAPNTPFFETAHGLVTAPFDQFGDLFRKWPQHV